MKRGGPLQRKTPLKSGGELQRKPLKRRSEKRERLMADDRRPLIQSLVDAGFGCEIGPVLAEFGIEQARYCTGQINGMHERRKRSSGGSLTNRANLVPACNMCNGAIEDNPEIEKLTGSILVVREGNAEWESLGARADLNDDA